MTVFWCRDRRWATSSVECKQKWTRLSTSKSVSRLTTPELTGCHPDRFWIEGDLDRIWNRVEALVDGNGWLTISEAAKALGISDDVVRKRLKAGAIKGKKVGKRWLIDPDAIGVNPDTIRMHPDGKAGNPDGIQTASGTNPDATEALIQELREHNGQLREHIEFLKGQLSVKDDHLARLLIDLEGWREQVRYKELQVAQLQDRVIELPSPEEAEPTEQKPELSQPGESGNVLRRFWHWLGGGE
jgi:excisionase family DNA binding protein